VAHGSSVSGIRGFSAKKLLATTTFSERHTNHPGASSRINTFNNNHGDTCVGNRGYLLNPGRTKYSSMEAPDPPDAVVPLAASFFSRPGPAFGPGEGCFHTASLGKYHRHLVSFEICFSDEIPDHSSHSGFSTTSSSDISLSNRTQLAPIAFSSNDVASFVTNATPGHSHGTMEAPGPSNAVEPSVDPVTQHIPGPAFGVGEGFFQQILSGKFLSSCLYSLLDEGSNFS